MALTLQGITERAQGIQRSLTDRFDVKQAQQEADNLWHDGIQLMIAELNDQPKFVDIVSPVVVILTSVVSLETIQHQVPLHQALSKAYRVFVELTWYQCFKQKEKALPVFTKTRTGIVEASREMIKVLPSDKVGTRFEYRTAKHAANILSPTEAIWKKYLDHVLSVGEAGEGGSFFGIAKGLINLGKDVKKDWIGRWYPDVFFTRWQANLVTTKQDFNQMIEPQLSNFKEKGRKYTLCLATVFVELIQNPEVNQSVKKQAAQELENLFQLEDKGRVSAYMKKFSEKKPESKILHKSAKKIDRYRETRALILDSLDELAKNPDTKKCIGETAKKLVEMQAHKQQGQSNKSLGDDEGLPIRSSINRLQKAKEKCQKVIDETNAVYDSMEESEKVAAREKLDKAQAEKNEVETKLETLQLAKSVLKELQEEEQVYLERLEKIHSLIE